MDSQDFFGFDISLPVDDDSNGLDEDGEEYNALNEETFGSAAVAEDWEEDHLLFSSLSEAERNGWSDSSTSKSFDKSFLSNDIGKLNIKDSFENAEKKDATFFSQLKPPSPSDIASMFSDANIQSIKDIWKTNENDISYSLDSGAFSFPPSRIGYPPGLSPISSGIKTVAEIEEELIRSSRQQLAAKCLTGGYQSDKCSHPLVSTPYNIRSSQQADLKHLNLAGISQNTISQQLLSHVSVKGNYSHNRPFGVHGQYGMFSANPGGFSNHYLNAHLDSLPFNSYKNRHKSHERPFDRKHYNRQFDNRMHDSPGELSPGSCGRVRRDSEAEWEEWYRIRELDPYAGLMTPKEKMWLKNLQGMLLHTDNPYEDDYYFIMVSVKKNKSREEELFDGLKHIVADKGKDLGKEYKPPHMENSLGKLQVASVTAPRKIIDLEAVHLNSQLPVTQLQKDMRKHRQLLLFIEKLYSQLMEVDDYERKIRILMDCPTRDHFHMKAKQMTIGIWSKVTCSQEKFLQVLCVRKGKSLVARLLNWLGETECDRLVTTVLQNMPILSKKDMQDQYIPLFWTTADRLLGSAPKIRLINYAHILTKQSCTSQPSLLSSVLRSQFGLSVIMALLVRGEMLWPELDDQPVWQQFLTDVISSLAECTVSTEEKDNSNDKTQTELPLPLPSLFLTSVSCKPSAHLCRCAKLDASQLRAATDLLISLEASLQRPQP